MTSPPPKRARFSVAVPTALKQELTETIEALRRDGYRTSEAEVIHMFIREGLCRPEILERLLQHNRDLNEQS